MCGCASGLIWFIYLSGAEKRVEREHETIAGEWWEEAKLQWRYAMALVNARMAREARAEESGSPCQLEEKQAKAQFR